MAKEIWKPGNMLYPLPAVMVSCGDREGRTNIITVAWTGTVCTNPAMVYISVRPQRYSYDLLRDSGEFVINLTTEKLLRAADWCGVKSGRDTDKWKEMHLTPGRASRLDWAPVIEEAFLQVECTLEEAKDLSGAGITAMVVGRVRHMSVEAAYAQGYARYGREGFMLLAPAPQDLVTGAPNASAIATVRIEKYD